ncbi:MAG: hypothetical protein QG625_987 [Cyanobacteriota bacterium erpe_2018_sw_39hr_WHONDRS-SW48-000098_B_bin.30]|nr:hypothetical protein [Cyanobacteriota bacterium erpe_2018_sw_39hr_WHONDRS-SW48-000098_B_bin.30]
MIKTKKEEMAKASFREPPIEAAYLEKPVHLQTRSDRYEAGRALRVICPRESHAEFTRDRDGRPDPIELLIKTGEGRIEQLLPIRYGRMLTSPFAFFRGAAAIMAADLDVSPSTGYAVQACGDCHLMNFGAFASPERNIIFDINDFDETFPAPWEWDLKRLAASFVIASRNNGHKRADAKAAAARVVQAYRDKLRDLSRMKTLEAWYSYLDYKALIDMTEDTQLKKRRKKVLAKALSRDSVEEFVKLGHVVGGKPRIKDQPPLIYHQEGHDTPEYKARILESVDRYRQSLSVERRVLFDRYELVDNAMKVVGVGSVGTTCGIALLFAAEEDPLFLQVKEANQSVLEPYSHFANHDTNGGRVVNGQRLMQAASDLFLGHYVGDSDKHHYVRQLRDVKVKPLVEIFNPGNMLGFARNCGWALARAHARSGDAAIIAGYIGKGDTLPDAIAQYAESYADQNESDYKKLVEAIREGRIEVYTE